MSHCEGEPVLVFRSQADRGHPFAKRELLEVLPQVLPGFTEDSLSGRVPCGAASLRSIHENPVHKAQLKRAAIAHAKISCVGHGIHRHASLEPGRIRQRERMLCASRVGGADGGESTVTPGLLHNPRRRVEAVGGIVGHHVPDSFGRVPSSSVLDDADITSARIVRGPARAVFVVGRALEDRGKLAFQPGAVARRKVEISRELDAVTHRDHHVFLDRKGSGFDRRPFLRGRDEGGEQYTDADGSQAEFHPDSSCRVRFEIT